jgi:hypothetical protein
MRCPSSEVVRNLSIGRTHRWVHAAQPPKTLLLRRMSILIVRPAELTRRPTDPQDRALGVAAFPPEHLLSVLYSLSDRHALFSAACKEPCQAIASSSGTPALPLPSRSAGRAQPKIAGRIVDKDVRGGALAGRQRDVATSEGDLSAADGPSARWVPVPRVMHPHPRERFDATHLHHRRRTDRSAQCGRIATHPRSRDAACPLQVQTPRKSSQRPDHLTENYLYR